MADNGDDTETIAKIIPLFDVGRAAEAMKLVCQTYAFSAENPHLLRILPRFLLELGFVDESSSISAHADRLDAHLGLTHLGLEQKQMIDEHGSEWVSSGTNDRYSNPSWNLRAKYIATLMSNPAKVLDLGCANMLMKEHLPSGVEYVPCDIVARDEHTLVCDFDKDPLPAVDGVSHVICLGVLNYLNNPHNFLKQLSQYNAMILLTFKPKDLPGYREGKRNLAHYPSIDEVYATLQAAGFDCHIKRIMGGYDEVLITGTLRS